MLPYIKWILVAVPAIALVIVAARGTTLDLRGTGLLLVAITCLAPLQIYAVWRWNHGYGVLYALVCYAAAGGLALRLSDHRGADTLHWPLIIFLLLTVIAGLAALPTITWPRIRSTLKADKHTDHSGIDETLRQLDVALTDMQQKQDQLQISRANLIQALDELHRHRANLLRQIDEAERRKEEARRRLEHPTPKWVEHLISFVIGVASSVFYAAAAKFLQRT